MRKRKKFGVIALAYNCREDLESRLQPWIQARRDFDIEISVVSVCFLEYPKDATANIPTQSYLESLRDGKVIDYLHTSMQQHTEAEAMNFALRPLQESQCDYIWLLGAQDEYYTAEQIINIINFVERSPEIGWYSIHFKNYVFDGSVWVDGFCPPRIFKVETSENYKLSSFYWDDSPAYSGVLTRDFLKYTSFPSAKIPKNIAHVRHMTWLNNENSKKKVEYQLAHFGDCSYRWNSFSNCLEFNTDYYQKIGQPIPILNKD